MRCGTRRSPATPQESPARFSTSLQSMAAPSRFPRRGPPDLAQAADEISRSAGGSMLLKIIGVLIATVLIYGYEPIRPLWIPFAIIALAVVFVVEGVRVVPQQSAWVVERLGKFHQILEPGLNVIIPFIDRVAYRHSLKEVPLDVAEQVCITKDNTQLVVDGLIYFQVTDPRLASYGTSDYVTAIVQLAQTTLRSEVGKMELDQSLQSRDVINRQIVAGLDEAIGKEGGLQAANLKVAELYIGAFGNLAKTNNTMIVPSNLADVASVVASAMTVLDRTRAGAKPA